MSENEIDPVQFGRLLGRVDAMETAMSAIQKDVKALLELANKGKGGFWMGMTIASMLGAMVSWALKTWRP